MVLFWHASISTRNYLIYLIFYDYFILFNSCENAVFDPLGVNPDKLSGLSSAWESVLGLLSQTFESASRTKRDKSSSARGAAGRFLSFVPSFLYLIARSVRGEIYFTLVKSTSYFRYSVCSYKIKKCFSLFCPLLLMQK